MSWENYKIGDFLTRSKEPVRIKAQEEYTLVTIRMYHKGVAKRSHVKGSSIKSPTLYRVRAGQFILSGIDARNRAFGIVPEELNAAVVTNDFWTHDIDTSIIDINFFYWFTTTPQFYEACIKASEGTTNRQRLQADKFYSFDVLLPSIYEQREWVERISYIQNKYEQLDKELDRQQTYLKLLRQTILQEAVQGKLTKQDPTDEPATQLLKRIKAEKDKLIKAGKLKKEKELPPITEDKIPFEIPEGWAWCRLADVGILKRGKSKHRPRNDKRLFTNGTYPFIQTGEVSKAKKQGGLITSINGYYNDFGLQQSEMQKEGTLCITIAANIAEYGFLAIDACVPDSIVCFNSVADVISDYVSYFINVSKDMLEQFAPSTAQKNINLGILNALKFPLPPLAEQQRIVDKVKQLQKQLRQLEDQIQLSKQYCQQLLEAVLKEAFSNPV
jgi:type I restriction enzyme S subunit